MAGGAAQKRIATVANDRRALGLDKTISRLQRSACVITDFVELSDSEESDGPAKKHDVIDVDALDKIRT